MKLGQKGWISLTLSLVLITCLCLFAYKLLNRPAALEVVIQVRDGRTQENIEKGIGEPWTLEEIAQSIGMYSEYLMKINGISDPDEIYHGQVLNTVPYSDFDSVLVSWYGEESLGIMASGKPFDPEDENICAHRWLPFGTRVQLTCTTTGKSIIVVVQDRGPYVDMENRHFDISKAAAELLGIKEVGVAECRVKILPPED